MQKFDQQEKLNNFVYKPKKVNFLFKITSLYFTNKQCGREEEKKVHINLH